MKKLVIFSVFCGFLVMFWGGFFAPQARAILGDVNNDGGVNLGDVVYLITYLYKDGSPPPNPIDADVDGSPGINTGDVLQLESFIYNPGCNLLPYTGATIKESKEILFYADPLVIMAANTKDTSEIKIIRNAGPDLMGMVIPISYANKPGQVDVTLDTVDFTGSIIPVGWTTLAKVDNVNKKVLLSIFAHSGNPAIATGTVGLVAKLIFNKQGVDSLSHTPCVTEFPPSHSFMLIKSLCADAGNPPSDRIFTTTYRLTERGDVNCTGDVELGDVVRLIRYLYLFGPAPFGL